MKDFRAFILRGNVVDLAVGVVIGAAFGAVVTAFVKGMLTPLIGLPGTANFDTLTFEVSGSVFRYGSVITALINFLLIAIAVFFFVVKPVNHLMERRAAGQPVEAPGTKDCPHCLSSIPVAATVCAFCTREIESARRARVRSAPTRK